MIGLIGIKKNTPIEIRERLTVHSNKHKEVIDKLLKIMKEVVLLTTCNRTEIYFNISLVNEELLKEIFEIFEWDYKYREYVFFINDEHVCRHLFEVCCGFHSKILGEDQILGQVKGAYEEAIEEKSISMELQRLFQQAITCGKKFRTESKLFEIPVSSASIVVNESINKGCRRFMLMGYGEVGKLTMKYLLSHSIDIVYLVVRNQNIKNDISNERIKVISFEEKNKYIDDVQCIISCTSSPYPLLKKMDINDHGHELLIYDLAVPRDIDEDVETLMRTKVYNIDTISIINDENKRLRVEKMEQNKYILNKYLNEYYEWLKIRKLTPDIIELKELGKMIYEKRSKTLHNKSKSNENIELADMLIKSASDFYVNRAIEVLKEETLKGCGDECMNIIKKIFQMK